MPKTRFPIMAALGLAVVTAGCGSMPEFIAEDLKEVAKEAALDAADKIIDDVIDHMLDDLVPDDLSLPADLDPDSEFELDSATDPQP